MGMDNDGDGAMDEADEQVYYTFFGRHLDGVGFSAQFSNGLNQIEVSSKCYYPNPYFVNLPDDPFCLNTPPFNILVGEYNNAAGGVVPGSLQVNGVSTNTFNANALGIGSHLVTAIFDAGTATAWTQINGITITGSDAAALADPGCQQQITKVVQIVNTPANLACNDLLIISLDADCHQLLAADDVLEGSYFCYDDYVVELDKTAPFGNGPWVPAMLTAADIGKTYHLSRYVTAIRGQYLLGTDQNRGQIAARVHLPGQRDHCLQRGYRPVHTGQVVVPIAVPRRP